MARPTKSERLRKVHEASLSEFNRVQTATRDERQQNRDDRRFCVIAGAQWEDEWGQMWANKPRLESNKIQLSVLRIQNEYKNNKITANFEPVDGSKGDPLADAMDDAYRAAERRSDAEEAYDTAFDEGSTGGIGAWRLTTKYEDEYDEDNERCNIMIEPINDADTSVFYDLGAKRQDKSDAKRCWVLTSYTREGIAEEWGEDVASWPQTLEDNDFDWVKGNNVYVAEYYEIEEKTDTRYTYEMLDEEEKIVWKSDIDDEEVEEGELSIVEKIEAFGGVLDGTRKIKQRKVHKYFMSGNGILEDCGIIAGKYIPIIPYYGKRSYIDSIERASGHVRLPKDMQRLNNMQISKIAEIASLSSVEKPIFLAEQVAAHKAQWEDDNIKDYPYLVVDPVTDKDGNKVGQGPLGYTRSPQVPPALAGLLEYTGRDIKELLGNQENGEKMISNISSDTVGLIQERLDIQTFIYIYNFSRAVKWSGIVFMHMAKEVYGDKKLNEGRTIKGVTSSGSTRQIELFRPVLGDDGETIIENDFSNANLELYVDVGPSSDSRRQSTVRSLSSMLGITKDPETASAIELLIMMNIEGEGMADVRDFFRQKAIRVGIVKPDEDEQKVLDAEKQAAVNAEPTPDEEFLRASADKEAALALKAAAETEETAADIDKTRAQTEEIYEGIERDDKKLLLDITKE